MNNLDFENTAVAEAVIEEDSSDVMVSALPKVMEKLDRREELQRKRKYWVVRRA